MSALLDTYRLQRDGVTIPAIAIWIVLSILLHVALMLWVPRMRMSTANEKPEPPPMTVTLQSRPQPQVAPPPQMEPAPAIPAPKAAKPPPKPKRAIEKKAPAPIIARNKPVPEEPPFTVPTPPPVQTPPAPPVAAAPPKLTTPPPAETDLAAYVEARRSARGETPTDTDADRANRTALASAPLKPSAPLNFGSKNPSESGGIFEIRRRGYDYAEFMFFGWNSNFRRNGLQLIEVRKGDNSDIDIAVIRKMIAIIREYENGDFKWYSKRTGKTSTLSARARDNAWLEEFMLREFYDDLHRYR